MKICIISYLYPNPEKPILGSYVHEQAQELAKRHEVHVITRTRDSWRLPAYSLEEGIHVHRIPSEKEVLFPFVCFFRILALHKKNQFDLIHGHFLGVLSLFSSLAAKLMGRPYIITAYGIALDPKAVSLFKRAIIRLTFSFSAHIISISAYTQSLCLNYAPREKQSILTPGITEKKLTPTMSAQDFRKKHGLQGKKILLSVGGLVWRKGHDAIISSLPQVILKHPDVSYIIIGKGESEPMLRNLVRTLKLESHVIFWPNWASDDELVNFYHAADIFVLFSRTQGIAVEGFGMVYTEANAVGTPIIGGRGGGTSDAVSDGKTGFLVDTKDNTELTQKLLFLLSHESVRKKMGEEGKRFVRNNLLLKDKVADLERLYSSIIAQKK